MSQNDEIIQETKSSIWIHIPTRVILIIFGTKYN